MNISTKLLFAICFLTACNNSNTNGATAGGEDVKGLRVSQFERAGLSDFLIDKNGNYHIVFQESPAIGKPVFIYYTTSANHGASWSKPITISNDNTGNGAGYPRILQDGSGAIYAIWKRYGSFNSFAPNPDETLLDGPGGGIMGTIFYKVLTGGAWSNQVQINEDVGAQNSYCATVSPKGQLIIFWSQISPVSIASKSPNVWYWKYCDLLRVAVLNGTSHSAITSMSTPSEPPYAGATPKLADGIINLDGYVDENNGPHLIWEDKDANGVQHIKYSDNKGQKIVYSYPQYGQGNTFNNPAKLLRDENGHDHIILKPAASMLESEQIWDIDVAANKQNVIAAIQQKLVNISGFQGNQGPHGQMAITIEVTNRDNTESLGLFYKNGDWKTVGLTNNASKEKFFSRGFATPIGGTYYLSSLTRYNSQFNCVAYDAQGNKKMAMTISAYWTGEGFSTSSPSIVFSPIDK